MIHWQYILYLESWLKSLNSFLNALKFFSSLKFTWKYFQETCEIRFVGYLELSYLFLKKGGFLKTCFSAIMDMFSLLFMEKWGHWLHKTFFSVLYMGEKVIGYLEQSYVFCKQHGGQSKSAVYLCVVVLDVILFAFDQESAALILINLVFFVLWKSENVIIYL